MYVALDSKELFQIKFLSIITSIIPVLLVGMVSLTVTFGLGEHILFALAVAVASLIISIILSLIIRKSTLLEKVLPLIMLTALIAVFIKTII